jgi:hypothetical protein
VSLVAKKAAAKEVARLNRVVDRKRAVDMRRKSISYESIAHTMSITLREARALVAEAIAEIETETREDASEVIALELARLDEMATATYPLALEGDLKAVDAMIKIMDRRAKLLGIDSPEKIMALVASKSVDHHDERARMVNAQLAAALGVTLRTPSA